MCVAERAKIELMTKSYPKAASKKLERGCEPRVKVGLESLEPTSGFAAPIMCIARSLQASCLCIYSRDDESGASQSGKGYGNAERTANSSQGRGKCLSVAMFRYRSRSSESREGLALPESEELLPEDGPCNHICSCALCNFCCLYHQPPNWALSQERTYHCGKVSSHRMCLLLQVLHPFLDFV